MKNRLILILVISMPLLVKGQSILSPFLQNDSFNYSYYEIDSLEAKSIHTQFDFDNYLVDFSGYNTPISTRTMKYATAQNTIGYCEGLDSTYGINFVKKNLSYFYRCDSSSQFQVAVFDYVLPFNNVILTGIYDHPLLYQTTNKTKGFSKTDSAIINYPVIYKNQYNLAYDSIKIVGKRLLKMENKATGKVVIKGNTISTKSIFHVTWGTLDYYKPDSNLNWVLYESLVVLVDTAYFIIPFGSLVPMVSIYNNQFLFLIDSPDLALSTIKPLPNLRKVNIWPNPIEDIFYSDAENGFAFEIYDTKGRFIFNRELKRENKIDLPAGVYFMYLRNNSTGECAYKKLVIQ